jgi:type VI secretion system ImpM family protein
MSSPRPCAFGKVPRVGDFVRAKADAAPVPFFEELLTEGMSWATQRRPSWESDFGRGVAHAFVYRPSSKQPQDALLAGVIRPSHDAVGRLHPLVFAVPLDGRAISSAPHLLPLLLGDFLEQATDASMRADAVSKPQDLEAYVAHLHPPYLELGNVRSDYEMFARATGIGGALSSVYGDAWSMRGPHAIHTILEALAPVRGREPPDTRLSLRLPLGAAGSAAVAFWLDIVRAAGNWQRTVPSMFWRADAQEGVLLLQLGDTPSSSIAELWSPDEDADLVCDLVAGSQTIDPARSLSKLPQRVSAALYSPSTPVSAFVDVLWQR